MATIDVSPICDISITEKDLFKYYTENNIKNYPKKLNGMPKMKSKFNKTHALILYNKKALIIDDQYEQAIKDATKEKHSEVLKKKMEECKICVICSDDIKSVSMLECGHTMCVKCTISHFRVNNVCPFCRASVCDAPSVRLVMQNQTTIALIEQNLASLEADRFGLTMTEYIRNRLVHYKSGAKINLDGYTANIVKEIHASMVDLSTSINTWYA
jgi:hypothetical protein